MKKLLSVIIVLLVFVVGFSLSGCDRGAQSSSSALTLDESSSSSEIPASSQESSDSKTQSGADKKPAVSSKPQTTTTSSAQNKTDVSSRLQKVDYKDVECRDVSSYLGFENLRFATPSEKTDRKIIFNVPIVQDWELQKRSGGLEILRGGKKIGEITTLDSLKGPKESTNEFSGEIDKKTFTVYNDIYHIENTVDKFTRVIRLCSKGGKGVAIKYNMEELDGEGVMKIMGETEMSISSVGASLGSLPIFDDRGKIAILGNSFVGTSQIGSTLRKMCNGKIEVEAISIGMAHVGTYTENSYIMSRIKNGEFSTVFMCGLYSQTALDHFEDMVKACKSSNTRLVIFPAHNESRKIVTSACLMYPEVDILDWKGEIEEHIRSGIDYYTFCEDDTYDHSKPIAGYVGAQMIYRSIFGQIPELTSYDAVTKYELNILGSYVNTGEVDFKWGHQTYVLS